MTVSDRQAARADSFDEAVGGADATSQRATRANASGAPTSRLRSVPGGRVPARGEAPIWSERSGRSSGAWHEGDPVGRRRFVDIGGLDLERGGRLSQVRIAYETWGTLNEARDNVILAEHVGRHDEPLIGIDGAAGPDERVPPPG